MEAPNSSTLHGIHFPRKYQLEILDSVLQRNTIAFLPTGSGKTLISVLLIRHRLNLIRTLHRRKQAIAFLAPTKVLVGQQMRYIGANTDAVVRTYTGETSSHDDVLMDNWKVSDWERELQQVEVMVMTPEIMRNVLERSLLPLHAFDCVILDECHHAFGRHPMALVCDFINNKVVKPSGTRIRNTYRPHILAMTASPLGCKKGSVAEKILQLEKTTGCILVAPKDTIQELREVVPVPNLFLQRYTKDSGHVFGSPMEAFLTDVTALTTTMDYYKTNIFSFQDHPIPILLQAFLRIKHAAYLSDVYSLLRMCGVEANDLPELDGLMLPLRETWNKPHDRLVATYNDKISSSSPSLSSARRLNSLCRYQKDARMQVNIITQIIQQILTIVEEAGVLCALHAYHHAMSPCSQETEIRKSLLVSQMKSPSSAMVGQWSLAARTGTNKASFRSSSNRRSMASNIDFEQVTRLKGEILQGPFNPLELVDCDYCVRSSLLECFAALASLLGLENCKKAADNMRRCRKGVFQSMCDLNAPLGETNIEWERSDCLDPVSPGSSPLCGGRNGLDESALNKIANALRGEAGNKIQAGGLKGKSHDSSENSTLFQNAVNSFPTSSPDDGHSEVHNGSDEKYLGPSGGKTETDITDGEITAVEVVIRLLSVIGNGDHIATVEYGTVGIAESLWTYGGSICAGDFPSINNIRSAVSIGCSFLLKTIQPSQIVEHIQSRSRDFEYENLHQANSYYCIPTITSRAKVSAETTITVKFCKHSLISPKVCGVILDLFHRSEGGLQVWADLVNESRADKMQPDFGTAHLSSEISCNDSATVHGIAKLREGWSGIIFCRMRLTAISLSELIRTIQSSSKLEFRAHTRNSNLQESELSSASVMNTASAEPDILDEFSDEEAYDELLADEMDCEDGIEDSVGVEAPKVPTVFPIRPNFIIGSSSQKEQIDALQQFKAGKFNVLVATDVVEEGLDVGDCQIVINFDHPDTVKSFIQRRGRARTADSFMIALVPKGEEGIAIIQDLALYRQQELDMNVHGQNNSESKGDSNLTDIFEYCTRRLASDPSDNDCSDDMTSRDTNDGSIDGIVDEDSYCIENTGAFVGAGGALQVLIQYCQQLPHDSYHLPQPIFHMCPGYRCAILLPPAVPAEIRCIVGPVTSKKSSAKALAALECLRKLHQAGELNDWLLAISTYGTDKPISMKNEGAIVEMDTINAFVKNDNVELINDKEDVHVVLGPISESGNVVEVVVKMVPDAMLPDAPGVPMGVSEDPSNGTEVFFYGARCWPANYNEGRQKMATLGCNSCGTHVRAVNRIAIGVLKPVSEDVLETVFDMNLRRTISLQGKFEYLGSLVISDEEMVHMQRFHRHIMCWDTFFTGSKLPGNDNNDFENRSDLMISADEWSATSNGAWYIVLPLPEIYETFDSHTTDLISIERNKDTLSFLTVTYLKKVADEAYELVRNLWSHYKLQTESSLPGTLPRQSHHASDLVGCVFRRGDLDLFVGLPMNNPKKISDFVFPCKLHESFYEYYKSKGNVPTELLDEISEKPGHQLIHGLGISGRLSLIPLFLPLGPDVESLEVDNTNKRMKLARRREVFDRVTWTHKHSSSIHLIPEVCEILGKSAWFYIGQFAPSIVWRLQSLLLTQEVRCRIARAAERQQTAPSFDISKPDEGEEHVMPKTLFCKGHSLNEGNQRAPENVVFEKPSRNHNIKMPSVELMLEAITPRMALEPLNSERLEMLGDSFLKVAISVEIYRLYPNKHEGHLTTVRGHIVSNENLIKVAEKFGLLQYIRSLSIATGKQTLTFHPSGMNAVNSTTDPTTCLWNRSVVRSKKDTNVDVDLLSTSPDKEFTARSELNEISSLQRPVGGEGCAPMSVPTANSERNVREPAPSVDALTPEIESDSLPYERILKFSRTNIRKKCLADVVESIIGAFYVQGGVESAVAVMKALGIWPDIPPSEKTRGSCENNFDVAGAEVLVATSKEPQIPDNYPHLLTRIALGFKMNETPNDSHPEELRSPSNTPKSNFLVDRVEQKLGYRFKNCEILDLALTHCSCLNKQSNQRLEFLGDAVLDFAIVSLLFRDQRRADPGQLSQQKSEAARNRRLAAISLKLQVYKHLHIFSSSLMAELDNLELRRGLESKAMARADRNYKGINLHDKNSQSSKRDTNGGTSTTATEAMDKDLIVEYRVLDATPPSVNGILADLMEALVGAIFIDTKGSLDEIYKLIHRLNILPQLIHKNSYV